MQWEVLLKMDIATDDRTDSGAGGGGDPAAIFF